MEPTRLVLISEHLLHQLARVGTRRIDSGEWARDASVHALSLAALMPAVVVAVGLPVLVLYRVVTRRLSGHGEVLRAS